MAGPSRPPGPITAEKIIHVDSPAVRKKYEELAEKVKREAAEEIVHLETKLNSLRSDHHALQKEHEAVHKDRTRLANMRATEGTQQTSVAVAQDAAHHPEATARLHAQVARLKEELGSAHARMKDAESGQKVVAKVVEVPVKVEKLVYRERPRSKKRDSLVASLAALAGAMGGYQTKAVTPPHGWGSPAPAYVSPSPKPSEVPHANASSRARPVRPSQR